MEIKKNGAGPWAQCGADGVLLNISDGKGHNLQLDCAKLQRHKEQTFKIIYKDGQLAIGDPKAAPFIAVVVIPAAKYIDSDIEQMPAGANGADIGDGWLFTEDLVQERVPFAAEDMDAVKITLETLPA